MRGERIRFGAENEDPGGRKREGHPGPDSGGITFYTN